MLNHTDTEDDTCTSKKPICEKPLRELNLNIIADEIVYPAASVSNNVVEMPTTSGSNDVTSEMPAATSVGMDNVYEYHFIQDNQSTTNQHQCCTTLVQNLEVQNVILSNQTQILNELKSIKNAQNIIIQKVALFSIQLDDAVSQITQATDSNIEVTSLNEIKSAPSNTAFYVKPVENIQQLYDLEKQLSESSFRQKMKTTYSVLCNGGKGIDCAYTLADILFSREFLCECTWRGGSRGDDSKVAWKSFKHILSFFCEMVHSWDKTYTINENASFFKNILKNSKKRKMAKNQRASTSRKRSKISRADKENTTSEDTSNETDYGTIGKENPVTEKKKDNQEAENENNPEEKDEEAEK
ncbi:hypothetical protein evm_014128 [Chilo suppressalis]|nr:hypothetical protein evm_014128 [Chilo suppressalis]